MKQVPDFISKYPLVRAMMKPLAYPAVLARRALLRKKYVWQRQVMDNLTDVLVDNPVLRVREYGGVFEIDPRSDLFYRVVMNKCYEPELVKLCLKYLDKEKDVVDVGANVGFYTVLFANNIAGQRKVLAVEPSEKAIVKLCRNIGLNRVTDKVMIFKGVASDRGGLVEIKTIAGKEEYSTMGDMELPGARNEKWVLETVKSSTLDRLVAEKNLNPGFIKIDCEGAEHLVLKGAAAILKELRPIFFIELHHSLLLRNATSARGVAGFISSYGYSVFDPRNPVAELGANDPGDIICFPKEMGVGIL